MKSPEAEDFLCVSIGDVLYALPDGEVEDTVELPPPNRPWPAHLLRDGRRIELVDPRRLFQVSTPPPLRRWAVLQRLGGAPTAPTTALVVDSIFRRLRIDPRRFQPVPWHFGGREQLWFGGALDLDGERPLILLRSRGLAASCRASDPAGTIP